MEVQFTNKQVEINDLPQIETLHLTSLHKDYFTAKLLGTVIFWLFVILIVGAGIFIRDENIPFNLEIIGPVAIGMIVIFRLTTLYLGFKRKKYALREKDILYQSGLFWRSNTVIPFNRIQHAEVTQGPIERLFNLSVLRIFTAGGSSSDINIPGIQPQTANDIKEFILGKTSSDEEE